MMDMPPLPAVTLLSLLHFFGAILWSGVLLLSAAGYGGLLFRLLRQPRAGLAVTASVGFGPLLLLGGLLNLAHSVTRPALLGLVAVGLLAFVLFAGWRSRSEPVSSPGPLRLAGIVALVIFWAAFALRLGSSVHTPYYQVSDDFNFYLASPVKMLELHSFAPDPFSERRIMSSLGGNTLLEDLVLVVLPVEDVQMADRAVGLLLLALLSFHIARRFSLSRTQSAILAALFFVMPQLQFNLTFVILPSALFVALVAFSAGSSDPQRSPWITPLLIGLVVGAIASLKSTYVVHGVVFLVLYALLQARRFGLGAALRDVLIGGLACLIVLAPWMIASHAASATWFYPTLGKGFHYARYGMYPPPGNLRIGIILKKVLPFNLPMLLVAAAIWIWGRHDLPSRSAALLALAAAVASVLVGIATGGDSVRRYNYPCILPAFVLAYAVFAHAHNLLPASRRLRLAAGALIVLNLAIALYVGLNTFTYEYAWYVRSFRASLTDLRITPLAVRDEYAAIEKALPGDAAAIETVGHPFLFHFNQHQIFLADIPGAASLPPGWPVRQSGDQLSAYLARFGIRYLIYGYNDHAVTTDAAAQHTAEETTATQWIRSENAAQLDAHHQFEELAQTRRHLYDDGHIYVLDLASPRSAAP